MLGVETLIQNTFLASIASGVIGIPVTVMIFVH
jgi:hypothetical protein